MEQEIEFINDLLYRILDVHKNHIPGGKYLTDEFLLKKILNEIEPNIEKLGGTIELNNDQTFGPRYANFLSIMHCLEKYFKQHTDKDRFTSRIDLNSIITLNDLIKDNSPEEKLTIAEILLFLISISSKKNYYLDKIGEFEDNKYITGFFIHIEKYIVTGNDETFLSYIPNNHFYKYKEELEIIINDLKAKNEQLEANLLNMELKYKDKEKELEIAKSNSNFDIRAQEELFHNTLTYNQLKNDLNQKDLEILDIKRNQELINKKNEDNIKKLKEKIEGFKDISDEYMAVKTQNERLSSKIKELSAKSCEYDELVKAIEIKNKQIDNFLNEKKTYMSQIDLLAKELKQAHDKIRNSEYERKKVEIELNDIRKEYSRHEGQILSDKELILSPLRRNMLSQSEINEEVKLFDYGGESIIFENKEEVKQLVQEKDLLLQNISILKQDMEKLNSEKERANLERDKFEIEKQKLEIENEKIRFQMNNIEKELKKCEEEKFELLKKIEKIEKNDKTIIDTLKNDLTTSKSLYKKITHEKQSLQNELSNLQLENEKLKNECHNPRKSKPKDSVNVQNHDTLENLQLRSELNSYKQTIKEKDDVIRHLKDKLKNYEVNEQNVDKINQDMVKRTEDLEFYRRSYEEQKNRVNKEHELISNALYELALQFMNLKNDIQKKVALNEKS